MQSTIEGILAGLSDMHTHGRGGEVRGDEGGRVHYTDFPGSWENLEKFPASP